MTAINEEARPNRLLVLVVDDHIVFSQVVKHALHEHDFIYATTAEDAISMYKQYLPDITLLDIYLPDETGHTVLKAVKDFDPNAFVVMLTGSARENDVLQSKDNGANGYLVKPVTRVKLQQYINLYYNRQNTLLKDVLIHSHNRQNIIVSPPQIIKADDKYAELIAKLHILFISHYEANRHNSKFELEQCGYKVDTAISGNHALSILKIKDYPLVLMDCDMPEMDGYEATNKIRCHDRENGKHRYIIGLGLQERDAEKKWFVAGMNDYFQKPLRIYKLNEIIKKRLDTIFDPYYDDAIH